MQSLTRMRIRLLLAGLLLLAVLALAFFGLHPLSAARALAPSAATGPQLAAILGGNQLLLGMASSPTVYLPIIVH